MNNKLILLLVFFSFCLFSCRKQKQQIEIPEQQSADWFDDFIQETNKQGFSNKNETKESIQKRVIEENPKAENTTDNYSEEELALIKEDEKLAESFYGIYCPNGIYDPEQNVELSNANEGYILIKGLGHSNYKYTVYVQLLIDGKEANIDSGEFLNGSGSVEHRICIENNTLYYREYHDNYNGEGFFLVHEYMFEKMEK